jgi:xanthine dehydrogenase small subunit
VSPVPATIVLRVNGHEVEVDDDGSSLLGVLRDRLGLRAAKDGCSPQGQCGCCTVWVDGAPRVACVTPARRVAGRDVTTLEGVEAGVLDRWAVAFSEAGASQCGFCTPGILMRLIGGADRAPAPLEETAVTRALAAHLCRCTGWRTIIDAARSAQAPAGPAPAPRDLDAASRRAGIEGNATQAVGTDVVLGRGGFADDTAPPGALVAVPDGRGGWAVGESLHDARRSAGKVQGRRSPGGVRHPLEVPPGEWALTLRTTWVEPAYLEADATWCAPGGQPAPVLANGGAFGAKVSDELGRVARSLADEHGRPVRVLLSREDAVRSGPKRPPVAAGVDGSGRGVMRVVRTPGIAAAVASVAPALVVEEVEVPGPPTSARIRAAGWAEAAVLSSVLEARRGGATNAVEVVAPSGGRARAEMTGTGGVRVSVACGEILDEVVLRSYCMGAAHMALGWVRSEAIAVDEAGRPLDLTIRSFGILPARAMPAVEVELVDTGGPPVNGSDAVFAAVAASAWLEDGLVQDWPTRKGATR